MHVCEVCKAEHKSDHWNTKAAQTKGWFFTRNSIGVPGKAYCPEHNPPWVATWRAKKAAAP